jgi:Ser/Thr protein kinase RdoA (MazF antagonist)
VDYSDVVQFLLAQKVISSSALIQDGFRIEDRSRRNRNMRIEIPGRRGFFVKIATDREQQNTLLREARAYRVLCSHAQQRSRKGNGDRQALCPSIRLFDEKASILVLELLGQDNLKALCLRRRLATSRLRVLGQMLGTLHRKLSAVPTPPQDWPVSYPLPFYLPVPPKHLLENSSPGSVALLRIIQASTGLNGELVKLTERWNVQCEISPQLVHGDLRLENCCIAVKSKQLRIVDWEFTGIGDPLWDVAAVLADLISAWLMSASMPGGSESAKWIDQATIPIVWLRSAGSNFWKGYTAASGLADSRREQALRNTMRYTAARLLQLAYEHLQGYADLTVHAVSHAQLSENLMRLPMEGAARISGIAA